MTKIETSSFRRLLGVWNTSGQIVSDNGVLTLSGTDSYEIVLDGNYILHKADVRMGNEKSETFEIISYDRSNHQAKMQYFNSKGESGMMSGSLADNDYKIEGEGIKFIGKLSSQNAELVGKWYLQTDEENWTEFIDLKLEKKN